MLKTAPDPVDIQDLQFKLRCRLKVFDPNEGTNFSKPCNLVACASHFGLIFVGTNVTSFQVIQLKHFEEITKSDGDKADYPRRTVPLPSSPSFLSVNCEHTFLCVVIEKNNCPCALFYDVKSFWHKDIIHLKEVRLSTTPGVYVLDVNWNPTLSGIFTACKSDGTLGIYELKDSGIEINELPAAAGATCFCWSPKGKQIAVGSRDGKITQYKPDLKAVKVINAPALKEPHLVTSLQWISNYQFIGVFQPVNSTSQFCLIVIDSPKTGESTYINYDDICYSNGTTRAAQFYMITQQQWNILMVASSNSMEVGVLGQSNECWTQWIMGDAARAELPLSSDHQETLPVGFGLDTGCMQQLQWGESVLPPCPILLILSNYGTLCCFNIVNLKKGIPTICTPPDVIKEATGLQHFVSESEKSKRNLTVKDQNQQQLSNQTPKTIQMKATKSVDGTGPVFEIQSNSNKPSGLNFPTPQQLFGGQATLIPITQTNKTVTSESLNPVITYQYQTPFSLINKENKVVGLPPSTQKTNITVSQQQVTSSPSISFSKINQQSKLKGETKSDVGLKPEDEAEALFAQMVKEECVFLESELKVILHQGRTLKLNLGADDDKMKIVEATKSVQDFFLELVDICTTQNSEVHTLKQNLLQCWAWYEEVKSRYMASKDESMMVLLRVQPLDSASEKQLENIKHVNYYLESQIAQAHRGLDEQWENFQDYCKKTHKTQIPTMEMIFQTMVKQNAILRKQNYILKDIGSRIKNKSRSALGSSLLISLGDTKDLPQEFRRLTVSPGDICQMQYEHVTNRMKKFTKKKTDSLRSFLKERKYSHISAVKPQLTTSVIQASPSTKIKSINLPNSTASFIKEKIPKKLELPQSTPKPTFNPKPETIMVKQVPTPIEGLQNFTLKFGAKNFAKTSEQTFTPLSKTVISCSPNSAFVSTSFGTVVSTSISTSFKPVVFGTTTTSVAKPQFNFVITTTTASSSSATSSTSTPLKAFPTFTGTSVGTVFQQNSNEKELPTTSFISSSAVDVPATSTTATGKSSFSFTVPKTVPAEPFTEKTQIKISTTNSISDTGTSKPNLAITSVFGGGVMVSTKSVTSTNNALNLANVLNKTSAVTTATTSSTTPFSITSAQHIFGVTVSTKSNEPVTSTKPFIFSSVATATKSTSFPSTAATAQNRNVVANASPTPRESMTFVSSVSTSSDNTKSISSSQQSTTTPSVVLTSKPQSPVSTSPMFSSKPIISGIFTMTSSAPSSIFKTSTSSVSNQTSIFSTVTTKPSTIFGSAAAVIPATTTIVSTVSAVCIPSVTSISSTSSTPTAVFGTTTSASTQQTIFGSVTTTTSVSQSQPSTFVPANSTTGFTFGTATPSTKPVIFGGTDLNSTKPSIFGSTATPTTSSSIFAPSTTTQTVTPVFGTSVIPTSSQPSVFGNATTTTAPIFGIFSGDTTGQKSSIFGNGTSTTSQPSIFGGTSIQSSSMFGTATTSSSTFSQNNQSIFDTSKSAGTPSIFGQTATGFGSSGSTSSSFGNTNIFGNAATSFGQSTVFGSTVTTTSGSIFGSTPTTSFGSNTSVFGTPASSSSSVFGSGNVFSTTTTQSTTPFVSNNNTSAGTFGFGSLNVATPSTSGSSFGMSQPANPFGGGSKNIFGNSSTGTSSSTSSVFGGSSSLFGNPAQQSFGSGFGSQSVFGQQSTFGQSAFGSGAAFGQQSAGPFSGGSSGSVAQSGFGGAATFQKPAGFGSSPVFGSSPSFGNPPSFGGAPSFGSPPTFGSPTKIFGSGNTSFGTTGNTQNASFGNLANQPTVGFGNLAQQASNAPTPATPFSGNSSFSSWR